MALGAVRISSLVVLVLSDNHIGGECSVFYIDKINDYLPPNLILKVKMNHYARTYEGYIHVYHNIPYVEDEKITPEIIKTVLRSAMDRSLSKYKISDLESMTEEQIFQQLTVDEYLIDALIFAGIEIPF